MKKLEFEEILNSAHEKAISEMAQRLKKLPDSDSCDMGQLLAFIATQSVEAAENSVINTLVQAGFISFDD